MVTTATHRRNTTHQHTLTQNGRTGSRTGSRAKGRANSGTDGGLGAGLVLDEAAAVRFLPSGLPLALRWRGGLWQVIGSPVSGFSPDNRPGPASTPTPLYEARGTAGTRFWRFQAQTGPASPVLEFEMSADTRSTDWQLRRVIGVDGF